ncbi:hypothetical protein [uncultured Pluralibacter sp.]|uniref:hypothetical protein n=1 Tax=uncultured Pluralibacter sp. TaxID=1490864 RepID=UPI00261759D9|nr:hypothetical protein [uncultured Pluralibacter sp.]
MKKDLLWLAAGALTLGGCAHSPAHRIATCEKQGQSEAACTAAEKQYEQAHPLPQYDPTQYDNAAVLQSAFDVNAERHRQKGG